MLQFLAEPEKKNKNGLRQIWICGIADLEPNFIITPSLSLEPKSKLWEGLNSASSHLGPIRQLKPISKQRQAERHVVCWGDKPQMFIVLLRP